MSKPKTRRIASNRHPSAVAGPQTSADDAPKVVDLTATTEASPLLLHPAAEQALVAVGRVADELAKLNASMDKLIAAKGDAVRPAVEALAEQLIGFLDATAGDPDLEEEPEGDGDNGGIVDDEPSLGAAETANQDRAWSGGQNPTTDDREEQNEDGDEIDTLEVDEVELKGGEADGDNGGCVDDERTMAGSANCDGAGLIGMSSGPAAISNTTRPSTRSASKTCRMMATATGWLSDLPIEGQLSGRPSFYFR